MRRASMNEEAPPPDFPEGGESWHQRCVLDRPATDVADTGDAGGKGELLGAGEKGEVAAGPGVGADVGLVGRAAPRQGGGGGETRAISQITYPTICNMSLANKSNVFI
nr:unnamed protein product [Digitaria exilis]